MFVYTVYGVPGVAHKEPGRRVSGVSRIEAARPTERSWVTQKQNSEQTQRLQAMQRESGDYSSMAQASSAAVSSRESPPEERIGELRLTGGAQSLVLEQRRAKSILAPNFSGYIDKLGEIRRDIQSHRAEKVRAEVGIAQI